MPRVVGIILLLLGVGRAACSPEEGQAPPERYEVVATLNLPNGSWLKHAFRAVALNVPYVYVLDRCGDLNIFKIETNQVGQAPRPIRVLSDVGDGNALTILDGVLYVTRRGKVEVYSLGDPGDPRHLGQFGPSQNDYLTHAIVRSDERLYLTGRKALSVYDVSTPTAPLHLATIQTDRDGFSGCIIRKLLYLADAGLEEDNPGGIAVFDISDAISVREIGYATTQHGPYSIASLADDRLIVSLESGARHHTISSNNITVNGSAAVFRLQQSGIPEFVKEFTGSGGRVSTILRYGGQIDLVCNGVVFRVDEDELKSVYSFFPEGASNLDGQPYHGDSDGRFAAVVGDRAATVLRLVKSE